MMSDTKRLDSFYNQLKSLHKTYFPDMEFGELIYLFSNWVYVWKDKHISKLDNNEVLDTFYDYIKEHYKGVLNG